ncbi:MAG TPA: YibE/F family protein [Micromonosporaceae bacterium]|nr:YibE/F family protein [Micromonosporaceae bacterium]
MLDDDTAPIPRTEGGRRPSALAEAPRPDHRHDHRPPPPASRRVRTLVGVLLAPFALAAVIGMVLLFEPTSGRAAGAATPVHGEVTAVVAGSCTTDVTVGAPTGDNCVTVTVRMTDGPAGGRSVSIVVPVEPSTPRFAAGDQVVLAYAGGDPLQGQSYQVVDFQRGVPLILLAGLFAVAVLVFGRWQGLKSLVGLGLSFAVLVLFVLPAIIAGHNPLLVATCGAGVIMFAVLYLTHGLSARTSTAVLGTLVSLALIGVLGALFSVVTRLTGLDEDTGTLVGALGHGIDTRGLLLAGLVIGALGVLDDVTVTQASAIWELRAARPAATRRQLYAAGVRIGRDHVSSAVNTLVMAYAGAALPVLLYSSIAGVGLGGILSSESVAQEILRALVGSIGLVAAVPLTTGLAALVASQEGSPAVADRSRS